MPYKGLSRLLRIHLKLLPLIHKGFKIGGVEMPGKTSGIATLYFVACGVEAFNHVETPEKVSGIATQLLFPSKNGR